MNNWRLLLFALVAVFQPIASFTERNLFDGRQQCCEHLSSTPLRDTRSFLHGTYRLGKTTPARRRLNDRVEIREDRHNELRQRESVLRLTERPRVDIRERGARQGPFEETRFFRVDYSLESQANDVYRNRILEDVHERERTARNIRDLKPQDLTRRVLDRSGNAIERRNDREASRNRLSRDESRTERSAKERLSSKSYDSQREIQRGQSRRTEDDFARIEASSYMNNRQHIARERLSMLGRESLIRADTWRNSDNRKERQIQNRNNEQRRSLSENLRLIDGIMSVRLNSREEMRENSQRKNANQQVSMKRFDEHSERVDSNRRSRQQNKENTDRRLSGERIQTIRRIKRESRVMSEINTQNERNVDVRREIRYNERMQKTRDETTEQDQGLFRVRTQIERKISRESRNIIPLNERNVDDRRKLKHNERNTRVTRNEIRDNPDLGLSRGRIHIERGNIRELKARNIPNDRDVDSRREIRCNEKRSVERRQEIREDPDHRLSRERIQIVRTNIREIRAKNTPNKRGADSQREIKYNKERSAERRQEPSENLDHGLSREKIEMERRTFHEIRARNTPSERDVDIRREVRYILERTTMSRREIRENPEQRLSRGRIQMERRNIREIRARHSPNERNIDSRREIQYNEERSTERRQEIRENSDHRLSNGRIQLKQRNIRESRARNRPKKRDVESRKEIKYDERLPAEKRENSNYRLSRERVQVDRRHTRESRIMNTLNERDLSNRQEIGHNERLSFDRRLARENRQVDRRDVRESRIINSVRNERDAVNRPEMRQTDRLYSQIPFNHLNRERLGELRSTNRVMTEERDNSGVDRRVRLVNRRNFRGISADSSPSRDSRTKLFRNRVEQNYRIENRERLAIDARYRNVDSVRNREGISPMVVEKMETENDSIVANWQYVLYTLQAAYLCALFMQMLRPSHTEKSKKMSLHWLPMSSHYNPIKVD